MLYSRQETFIAECIVFERNLLKPSVLYLG